MSWLSRLATLVVIYLASPAVTTSSAAAESTDFHIARQPGIVYLQPVVMEERKLVEKHARALGLNDLKVRWSIITSGGVMTEALISESIDMAVTGISNMLLLWNWTNGGVKSVAGVAGTPFLLLTRNPNVKTIRDFGPDDRIAVPTIRVSMQAMLLGMALEQAYGPGQHSKLDSNQVQIGHPDAMQALVNPRHEINSHFSIPPYQDIALKSPGVHTVANSIDILGGPATITNAWTSQKFVDANPLKLKAFVAALEEANELIAKNPKEFGGDLSQCHQGEDLGRGTDSADKASGLDLLRDATAQHAVGRLHELHRSDQDQAGELEGLYVSCHSRSLRKLSRSA